MERAAGNPMLGAAREYIERGWPIFRLAPGAKVPMKGSHGHRDATTDRATIERWWTETPNANIGLACGRDGAPIAFDLDGPGGIEEFRGLRASATLVQVTRRGFHVLYIPPPGVTIRNHNARRAKGADGIDVKGLGGYIALAPSFDRRTGHRYSWHERQLPIAALPPHLLSWLEERSGARGKRRMATGVEKVGFANFPPKPPWLVSGDRESLTDILLASQRADVLAALREIGPPGPGYDHWWKIGAALHDWDPSPAGLVIFKAWSRRHPDYRDAEHQEACDKKWADYGRQREPGAEKVTIATVYALAREARANKPIEQTNRHDVPPSQRIARFIDFDRHRKPRPSTTNAGIAIEALGVICRKDMFHEKMLVGGYPIQAWAGALSDDVVHMLRKIIKRQYGFDPGEKPTRDAAIQLCLENQFNPVTAYLDGLCWDGRERLGRWVVDYLGARDTPLNREFGRLMLIAAVRRARHPGAKFDQILVLEGVEGTGKSSALRILADDDNFSDQNILAGSDREQQEAFQGIWIHEIAELAGMRRTDVERVKQFASRTEDRARPAYGRIRVDMKRRGIFVATTNEETYLKSETGNRRFWPIETGTINLERLKRDRDQLWAEAAVCEARGDSIVLDEKFRKIAAEEQERRLDEDAWHDRVATWAQTQNKEITVSDVLQNCLHLTMAQIGQLEQNRAVRILKRIGYRRKQKRVDGRRKWIYHLPSGDKW
jgi:Virulence-associated protein E/Bifunctional DNA primase/polymerase, N-terminal/Primase C terminal 2 (PriCT-2)